MLFCFSAVVLRVRDLDHSLLSLVDLRSFIRTFPPLFVWFLPFISFFLLSLLSLLSVSQGRRKRKRSSDSFEFKKPIKALSEDKSDGDGRLEEKLHACMFEPNALDHSSDLVLHKWNQNK